MRRSLIRNLVLLSLLTSGTILAVVLVAAHRSVDELSRMVIQSTEARVNAQLTGFFESVRQVLGAGADWGRSGRIRLDDPQSVNTLFMPIMTHVPQLSAVLIANEKGDSYYLMRRDDTWKSRMSRPAAWGSRDRWTSWRDQSNEVMEEWKDTGFDARGRPWFGEALSRKETAALHWTEPYTFFTTGEPGVTVSRAFQAPGGETLVLALDVQLMALSRFTTGLSVSPHGLALVLTHGGQVLGLPRDDRFEDVESIREAVLSRPDELGIPVLEDAVAAWHDRSDGDARIYSFRSGGGDWWVGADPFELDGGRRLWATVVVPEEDFLAGVIAQRNQGIAIAVIAVTLAVLLAFFLDRSFRRRVRKAVEAAKQLGQYTLQEKIGEGAMGSVYRAQHAMLRRPTAVKLLRAEKVNETTLARFEREAQLTSRLTHPNTIAVYDYGRTSNDVFYYAMEYLIGVDLKTLVSRMGPLEPGRVIHIVSQMCGSLAEAHDVGMVHRDIKPANIFLTERAGDPDFVKVVDFGLVKDLAGGDELEITRVNTLTGTPLYLSPESINAPATVGPHSDIYALGAVSYYLLTGRPVFQAKTIVEVCSKHLKQVPSKPSEVSERAFSEALEDVVMACLAKTPAQRPASAGAIVERLSACPEAADWGPVAAQRWWAKNGGALLGPELQASRESLRGEVNLAVDLRARVV